MKNSTQILDTAKRNSVQEYLPKISIPASQSHKGQNGKLLIIGGSELFHAASLWAAEIACHFVDIVHYVSVPENEKIFQQLKLVFRNGMIINHIDIDWYLKEDDAILIGPGMVRGELPVQLQSKTTLQNIFSLKNDAYTTFFATQLLIQQYADKKVVFDAGSLQMMDPIWLKEMRTTPIITPHEIEFEKLFNQSVHGLSEQEKAEIVQQKSLEYKCVILLKSIIDIVSDGTRTQIIRGGNAGLTKGGSGDILAGLVAALFTKTDAFTAATIGSFLLKTTADELFLTKGYWYSMSDLIQKIPEILKKLLYN